MAAPRGTATYRVQVDDRASDRLQKISTRFGASVKKMGAAVAKFTALYAAAFAAAAVSAVKAGDEIGKTARRLNISAETLQAWRVQIVDAGGDISAFEKGVLRFAKSWGEADAGISSTATQTLQRFGISTRDAAGNVLDTEQALRLVINLLGEFESHAEKAALANQVFGRGWHSLLLAFQGGTDAGDKFIEINQRLGITLNNDLVAGAERAQSALDLLAATFKGNLTRSVLSHSAAVEQLAATWATWIGVIATVLDKADDLFAGFFKTLAGDWAYFFSGRFLLGKENFKWAERAQLEFSLALETVYAAGADVQDAFAARLEERNQLLSQSLTDSVTPDYEAINGRLLTAQAAYDQWLQTLLQQTAALQFVQADVLAAEQLRLESQLEQRLQTIRDSGVQEVEIERQKAEAKARIDDLIAKKRTQSQRNTMQSVIGGFKQQIGAAAGHSKKAFKIQKALSIAEAVIAGMTAAERARAWGTSFGGPPLGAAMFAASWAATLVNVANIKKQKLGGGAASAPAASAGSVPAPQSTAPAAPPTQNINNYNRPRVEIFVESETGTYRAEQIRQIADEINEATGSGSLDSGVRGAPA